MSSVTSAPPGCTKIGVHGGGAAQEAGKSRGHPGREQQARGLQADSFHPPPSGASRQRAAAPSNTGRPRRNPARGWPPAKSRAPPSSSESHQQAGREAIRRAAGDPSRRRHQHTAGGSSSDSPTRAKAAKPHKALGHGRRVRGKRKPCRSQRGTFWGDGVQQGQSQ